MNLNGPRFAEAAGAAPAAPLSAAGGRGAAPPAARAPRTGAHAPAPASSVATAARVFGGGPETALAVGVVSIVALLVLPLPSFLLDALLALSFALSIVVLLVVLNSRDPLEFNIFPSLLILITMLRLGLNVSSTRLILTRGQAGQVIHAFGDFVIGGNVVVGLVIFLILVVINFMVITKGAGRIAEVAARFTLDAMPGRQMSIDADLSAGLIDEGEARRRRDEISRYADFYGAMDGAAKFVRGDAMAGLAITAINLLGGFVIGMSQQGLSASESFTTFSRLSVGDGLVTQIPALIVSIAAGLLVTYGSGGTSMAPNLGRQLTREPRVLWTASGLLGALALIPGLPTLPFLGLAGAGGALAWWLGRQTPEADETTDEAPSIVDPAATPALQDLMAVEPLEIEVGYALVPLVDEAQGGDLLQRIGILRKQLALELGILVPPARIRDNIQLGAGEYVIKMRGVRVAGAELLPRQVLALDTGGASGSLDGVRTKDPSFGMPAVWIGSEGRARAESLGWNVVEPATVLATHLMETIREHAHEMLSRQHVRELLDGLKTTHPALVDDVVPGKLSLGTVQRVLQRLLREGLPVRDLVTILEALSDAADFTKDVDQLVEQVRRALSHVIAQILGGATRPVRAITLGPRLEVALMHLFSPRTRESGALLDPDDLTRALQSLHQIVQDTQEGGQPPPLVTPPALRLGVRRLVEPVLPRLPVIALSELPTQTPLQTLRTWELSHAA